MTQSNSAESTSQSIAPHTPNKEALYAYHQERRNIYTSTDGMSEQAAIHLAIQDALTAFIIRDYPAIMAEFESIIFQPTNN